MSSQQPAVALEGGSDDSLGDFAKFGIVTVSDRASAGVYDDASGPAILQFFHEAIKSRRAAAAAAACTCWPFTCAPICAVVQLARLSLHLCSGCSCC